MGGYSTFVWPAYFLTAVVMLGLWLLSWRHLRQTEKDLNKIESHLASGVDR